MSRLLKAIGFISLVSSVVFATLIGTRLDEATIHVIAGIILGISVTVPTAACFVTLSMRHRYGSTTMPASLTQTVTPQYLAQPQFFSYPNPVAPATSHQEVHVPRRPPFKRHFYLIGEDGVTTEILSEDAVSVE